MYLSQDKSSKLRLIVSLILIAIAIIAVIFGILGKQEGTSPTAQTVGDDFIRVLDVGQGDSILITSNGKSMLVDTGTSMGANDLCSKLRGYGIRSLDVLLLTHFHNDHAGGLEEVTSRFTVENLIYPDAQKSDQVDSTAVNAKKNVLAEEGDFFVAKQGMSIELGDFEITVIGYYPDLKDENNRSIVLMVKLNKHKVLLAADMEKTAESVLIEDGINLECDVLKVGHHGSSSSSSEEFIKRCNPKATVISCGIGNQYSHPHEETLKLFEKEKLNLYRTDLNGDITLQILPDNIEIECEKSDK